MAQEEAAPSVSDVTHRLRIISVNDVYLLDRLPRLKTLFDSERLPNTITTLPGDFLAPSVLSSMDKGRSMVGAINRLGVDAVCFGNHEQDIGNASLAQRIREFKGQWLNSNMPDLRVPPATRDGQPRVLPRHWIVDVQPEPGAADASSIQVAVGGFTLGGAGTPYEKNYYEPTAFLGAAGSIIPTLDAAKALLEELSVSAPEVKCLVPLTHQDMPEDRALAASGLVPVVIGGHDHDIIQETVDPHGCTVIKGGMDAKHAVVVDLEWAAQSPSPTVKIQLKNVLELPQSHLFFAALLSPLRPTQCTPVVTVCLNGRCKVDEYEPDAKLQSFVDKSLAPVKELEFSVIYEIPPAAAATEPLSSERVRFGPSTVARLFGDAVCSILHADTTLLNSGGFKGFTCYTESMTYADIKKELPYPTVMVVLPLPKQIIQTMVAASRAQWTSAPEEENNQAYQVDTGMTLAEDGTIAAIARAPVEDDKTYRVAISTYNIEHDPILAQFLAEHPEARVAGDSGRGLLEILVEYFCGLMWRRLLLAGAGQGQDLSNDPEAQRHALYELFLLFDKDKDGDIESKELQDALSARLGGNLSSSLLAKEMIQMVDLDEDGEVSVTELADGLARILQADKLS